MRDFLRAEGPGSGQPELPLELREPVLAPPWAGAVEAETEGNQDTGYWEA